MNEEQENDDKFNDRVIADVIDFLPPHMSTINISLLFSAILCAYDTEQEAIPDVFAIVDNMYPSIVASMKAQQSIYKMMNQPTQSD